MTPEQKTEFLEQSKSHFAADMLLKGTYGTKKGNEFKGCSIGCHLHHIYPRKTSRQISDLRDKHFRVAGYYGFPGWLALLQDTIFEGLPNGESAAWHVLLAEKLAGLPEEYDWQAALHRVHVAILRLSYQTAGLTQEVKRILDLHERAGKGDQVSNELCDATWSTTCSVRTAAESATYQEIRDGVLTALAA